MLKCLIIDDEELARKLLKNYIDRLDFLQLTGEIESPIEALSILKNTSIDVIFLDIQMPDIKGTDFAKMISSNTQIIFTTAYSEYALEGFELNAVDYLLKPITFERFLVAVNKIRNKIDTVDLEATITLKSGYDLYKIKYKDIHYIESDSEYVIFYTKDKKIMTLLTLKSLEKSLPPNLFMRVHRSFIINRKMVSALKGRDILIDQTKIPVSHSYYDQVKKQLF